MDDTVYFDAVAKLEWGAGGEFSASLKPAECKAILQALEKRTIKMNPTDEQIDKINRMLRDYRIGDPGDETDVR